jgi:cyclase
MGLAARIIPTLLARGDQLVKGARFDSWRSVGHVLTAAKIHAARGVDELILLDIAATPEGRGPDLKLVEKVAEAQFTPLTVGGGVRSVADVRALLAAGADKVAINSAAIERQRLIRECSDHFGRQAIVAAIDYRTLPCDCGTKHVAVMSHGVRRSVPIASHAPLHPLEWARALEDLGAGEILLTNADREGTMEGYDLAMIMTMARPILVPIIAHGGAGTYEHMAEALAAGASAVAAGAMFQFTDQTPRGAAEYLARRGVETRIP